MEKETYSSTCRKCPKSLNPKIVRNKHNRSMIQSNCAICGRKNLDLLKNIKLWDY